MKLTIKSHATQAACAAAQVIVQVVRARAREGRLCVVAFDVSERPEREQYESPNSVDLVLDELARMVNAGKVSLANLVACPVWETWPVREGGQGNTARLRQMLQSRTDICGANIWSLEAAARGEIPKVCQSMADRLSALGGIDAAILQIRGNERLGQNEIDAWSSARTRLVMTEGDGGFGRAITLGIADLCEAARVVVLGTGSGAAHAAKWWELGLPVDQPRGVWEVVLDAAAAAELSRERYPWRDGPIAKVGLSWTPEVIARAGLAEAGGEGLSFENCHELLATWDGVRADEDPQPALCKIADEYLRSRAIPQGWRCVVLVARDARGPECEVGGMLRALEKQGVVTHTVSATGQTGSATGLHTRVAHEEVSAWARAIQECVARHRTSHVVVCDDVSGPLAEIALHAAGQGVQVLCTRGVRSHRAEWFWPAARSHEPSAHDPGMQYLARLMGWSEGVECLGVVR